MRADQYHEERSGEHHLGMSLRGAQPLRQALRRSNPSRRVEVDCFASLAMTASRAVRRVLSRGGGEAKELALHRVDPAEIGRDVVVAAAFAGKQREAAPREGP